jgi:hypothetical protein
MLEIDYFNPVVDDWTEECMEEEIRERENCSFCLYVLTPEMTGVYSVAEVVDDSNKRPEKTILAVIGAKGCEWTKHQIKSLESVAKMVEGNGGKSFSELKEVADYINSLNT